MEIATQSQITKTEVQSLFKDYERKKVKIKETSNFMLNEGYDDALYYFVYGNTSRSMYEMSDLFKLEGALRKLDADYWEKVINMTDVKECMPAKDRNKWDEDIRDKKIPPFELQVVLDTVQMLLAQRGNFFAQKIDGLFKQLSGTHVTNSPMAFRQRMIISNVIDKFGFSNHYKMEYLHDFRKIVLKLQGRESVDAHDISFLITRIKDSNQWGEWISFDGGAYKLRLYKAGTVHLEISEDVAMELNRHLATLYPSVIATSTNKGNKVRVEKEHIVKQTFLDSKTVNQLSSVLDQYRHKDEFHARGTLSEEVKEILKYIGCTIGKAAHITFPPNSKSVLGYICRMGCMPDFKSHQFYPTPEEIALNMASILGYNEGLSVLEPSAGHGSLLKAVFKDSGAYDYKDFYAVELSELNCLILEREGFTNIIQGDFLKKGKLLSKFDRIIMNPPYTNNQWKEHLELALSLLNTGGVLVACLPNVQPKYEGFQKYFHCSYEDKFENTSITVSIVRYTKE